MFCLKVAKCLLHLHLERKIGHSRIYHLYHRCTKMIQEIYQDSKMSTSILAVTLRLYQIRLVRTTLEKNRMAFEQNSHWFNLVQQFQLWQKKLNVCSKVIPLSMAPALQPHLLACCSPFAILPGRSKGDINKASLGQIHRNIEASSWQRVQIHSTGNGMIQKCDTVGGTNGKSIKSCISLLIHIVIYSCIYIHNNIK